MPTPCSRWRNRPTASSATRCGAAAAEASPDSARRCIGSDRTFVGARRLPLSRSQAAGAVARYPVAFSRFRSAPMLFQHVAIAGLAHVDAPRRLGSDEIHARLKPTLDRLGIKTDMLRDIAGIQARRLWDENVQASDAATLAGVKALADAGIDPDKIGLLVNTSVSRDYLEPSTASIVSGNLGLGEMCQNFDVANACLAFLNGMDIASRMIERGEIDYALVVDGETANLAYEKTLERMGASTVTEEQFRNEMATLTLGSGAAAMVLARAELAP